MIMESENSTIKKKKNTKSEKQIKGLSFDYCREDTFCMAQNHENTPQIGWLNTRYQPRRDILGSPMTQ